jgi:hypothetical protein
MQFDTPFEEGLGATIHAQEAQNMQELKDCLVFIYW